MAYLHLLFSSLFFSFFSLRCRSRINLPLPHRNAMANQDNFANTHLSGEKMYISYYQWVPITIAISAVLFYLPFVLWCSLTQNSGFYYKHIFYGEYFSYCYQARSYMSWVLVCLEGPVLDNT